MPICKCVSLQGSIPACAGEPMDQARWLQMGGVDPRVCGGAGAVWAPVMLSRGRSPRVRGSQQLIVAPQVGAGSIPACAGEPRGVQDLVERMRVDPRVCGGARRPGRADRWARGRSPRVRGSQSSGVVPHIMQRSIPACAGEPKVGVADKLLLEVDPRVCGGAYSIAHGPCAIEGRSPRVRGSHPGTAFSDKL